MRVKTTEVYRDWINSLKDRVGRARIQVRVDRLVHGNPGKYRALTDGVCELKIDVGPWVQGLLYRAWRRHDRAACRRRQVNAIARHQDRHRSREASVGVSRHGKDR